MPLLIHNVKDFNDDHIKNVLYLEVMFYLQNSGYWQRFVLCDNTNGVERRSEVVPDKEVSLEEGIDALLAMYDSNVEQYYKDIYIYGDLHKYPDLVKKVLAEKDRIRANEPQVRR